MIVDFHSHTLCSDGSLEPQALADMMAQRAVEAYSITDHDTLAAYGRFTPHAGARVVIGTEINTYYRNSEVHVLGYGLRVDDPAFAAFLVENREHRFTRAQRMVEQLRAGGYAITMADVERHAQGSKVLGRPHVARALVANGISSDIEAAFRGLLRRGRPGFVPSTFVTPQRASAAIRAAGGIAVLAHPGRVADAAIVDELCGAGEFDGLEIYYPLHDADDIARFERKASEYGLLATAGADFHDIRYHKGGVGMEVDAAALAPFFARVGLA
ncbi:MAG: PHP domain-containing protein [Candidatus Baltobacteraceae bacterium]